MYVCVCVCDLHFQKCSSSNTSTSKKIFKNFQIFVNHDFEVKKKDLRLNKQILLFLKIKN